jgi:SAM-dependent methyltransferase
MSTDDASRIQREQEFHDQRFAEGEGTRPAGRFYRMAKGIESFYDDRIARVEPGQSVLELGCGLKVGAWSLAERGIDVTGIDISEVAISQVKDLAVERGLDDHTNFLHMNAEQLTFPDESFDVVVGNGILHHLDLDLALSGIRRVLRPGGWAAFREPLGHNPFVNAYRRLTPDQRTDDEHPLLAADLRTIERYFPGSEHQYFNLLDLLSVVALKSKHFDAVHATLARADQRLFARVPALRRYGWMVGIDLRKPAA